MDNEEQDQTQLDNEDALDDLEESAGRASADAAPPATDNDGSDTESKRINDLMSKWQASEAENARLKAQLDGGDAQPTKGKRQRRQSEDQDQFMEFAREQARNTLFGSDPRLAKYGVAPDAITGTTPEEMRESFSRQQKLIDSLESKIRNEVLQQHGLDLGVAGGGRQENTPDFGKMSQDEFIKYIERRDGLL